MWKIVRGTKTYMSNFYELKKNDKNLGPVYRNIKSVKILSCVQFYTLFIYTTVSQRKKFKKDSFGGITL